MPLCAQGISGGAIYVQDVSVTGVKVDVTRSSFERTKACKYKRACVLTLTSDVGANPGGL